MSRGLRSDERQCAFDEGGQFPIVDGFRVGSGDAQWVLLVMVLFGVVVDVFQLGQGRLRPSESIPRRGPANLLDQIAKPLVLAQLHVKSQTDIALQNRPDAPNDTSS